MDEINFKVNLSYGDDKFLHDNDTTDPAIAEGFFMQFVFWGIVLPIIGLFGFLGNALTIVVLWRREMRSTTMLYLRVLVITDSIIIVGALIVLTPYSIADYTNDMHFKDAVYPLIFTPFNFIIMAAQCCNVWLTVSVTIERYIAICHPFRAHNICTKKTAYILIITICVISLVYNVPRLFATEATPCPVAHATEENTPYTGQPVVSLNETFGNITSDNSTILSSVIAGIYNTTVGISDSSNNTYVGDNSSAMNDTVAPETDAPACYILGDTALGSSEVFKKIYIGYMYLIIIYIIPLTGLFVLNILIIRELMNMAKRRSGVGGEEESEVNLSVILVLIVIVFLICQTPGLISQFDIFSFAAFLKWLSVSNTLFVVNSSVNFLIYTAVGKKFRRLLIVMLRHCVCADRGQAKVNDRSRQDTSSSDISAHKNNGGNGFPEEETMIVDMNAKLNGDILGEDEKSTEKHPDNTESDALLHRGLNGGSNPPDVILNGGIPLQTMDISRDHNIEL